MLFITFRISSNFCKSKLDHLSIFAFTLLPLVSYSMAENTLRRPKSTEIPSAEMPAAGPSRIPVEENKSDDSSEYGEDEHEEGDDAQSLDGFVEGMDPGGFIGEKTLKPLTPEALAAFKAAQDRAGVIYISRIPPGMRPPKVRHLMSNYGTVGRVYLQQEGAQSLLNGQFLVETNEFRSQTCILAT